MHLCSGAKARNGESAFAVEDHMQLALGAQQTPVCPDKLRRGGHISLLIKIGATHGVVPYHLWRPRVIYSAKVRDLE
jgi:hypothetical protein